MSLTHHAEARLRQRAIPPFVVEMLERYGSEMRCGGADRIFFDKAALKRVQRDADGRQALRAIERWRKAYIVVGDNGHVVTAAYKTRRFNRN